MLATSGGGGDDSRFRSLEKQCADLRQEQRQMAGWLSQSQQKLEAEGRARVVAEQAAEHLARQVDVMYAEMMTRSETLERDLQSTHDAGKRGTNATQEALSHLTGEVNALAVDIQSNTSG